MDKDAQVFQAMFKFCVGDEVEVYVRDPSLPTCNWCEGKITNICLSGTARDGFNVAFDINVGGRSYRAQASDIRASGSAELKAALAASTKERDELLVRVKKADDRTYARSLDVEAAVADRDNFKRKWEDAHDRALEAEKKLAEARLERASEIQVFVDGWANAFSIVGQGSTLADLVELKKTHEAHYEQLTASAREIARLRTENDRLYEQVHAPDSPAGTSARLAVENALLNGRLVEAQRANDLLRDLLRRERAKSWKEACETVARDTNERDAIDAG